jgi:subtilase family serine protease
MYRITDRGRFAGLTSRRRTRRTLLAVAAVAAAVLAMTAVAAGQASASTTRPIPNSAPKWLAHATHLGHAAASAKVSARVYLAPQGGLAALAQTANAMATSGSSSYHKFLTEAQYQAQYGPTSAQVAAVSSYLRSSGLHVTAVGAGNRYVAFTGTASTANRAFSTSIDRYRHGNADVQAPSGTLSVPANLAATVLTVTGLDTSAHQATPADVTPPPAGFRNARPCSTYYGQVKATYQADFHTKLPKFDNKVLAYAPCGYVGSQFRSAYENNSSLNGSGVTVAITDAYDAGTIASDANTYATLNGDGAYAAGQFTETDAATFTQQDACDAEGWAGEQTLDVEAVHAMAPGANIHYYGAASCSDPDLIDALSQVVIDDTAALVTNSWGEPQEGEDQTTVPAYESIFLQGAVEGISFMFSSGDNGDELDNTAIAQADYPTSDPYVSSIGGTSTAIGANGKVTFQTGWGTEKYALSGSGSAWNLTVPFLYGSGGGQSSLFSQPSYQSGVAPGAYRDVPDVAMNADPNTGMLVGETQVFPDGTYYDQYRIGGTSLASPLFAGLTALAVQHDGGDGVGLLNPVIYSHRTSFTDVKGKPGALGDVRVDYANGVDATDGLLYSVRTFDQDSNLAIGPGWDYVTGLGVPNTKWLTGLG